MKLSIIKKVMVGLAAMAGLASADQIVTDEYVYTAHSDEDCASIKCVSSAPISSMGLFKFEMSGSSKGYLTFTDAWKTNVSVMRRLQLRAFGKDPSTTYWSRVSAETLSEKIVDYGHFDPDTKSVSSTYLQDYSYEYTYAGTDDDVRLFADLNVFIESVAEKAQEKGFDMIRIALADFEYWSDLDDAYISVPSVQAQKVHNRHAHPTYVAFVDIQLIQGSISWYAKKFTHDGETKGYLVSTKAPREFDFIKSKDVVNAVAEINAERADDLRLEFGCLNSDGSWNQQMWTVWDSEFDESLLSHNLKFDTGLYQDCIVDNKSASFLWRMYHERADVYGIVYSDVITLNMLYKLTFGETEHGSQKINGDAAVGYGKAVDLQYKPDEGYEFECWQNEAGECVTSESNDAGDGWMSTSITLIGDTVLSAKFKPLQYRINWFVPSLEDGATNPWFKIYDYGTIPVAPVSLTSQVEKEDNEKYHYFVKVVPEITAVTQDQDYSIVLDSVLNDLSLHFNLNYDIGEDVSIELAEPNECLDVEKLSLRVYNDEGYSEGFALFNYKTNEWLAGGDGESEVHLWANKWNRFDAGVTLPKTGDCLNDEYVKSVNYAIQNNEDGKALVNIYINGEYSGRNRLDATNPDISFNYKFASTAYTVTWIVEGEIVETDNDVVYGSKPKYDGETPTKAADDKYTYEFADWKADVDGWTAESVVKSDVKFTAQFKSTEISSSSKEDDKSSSSAKPSSSSSSAKSSSSTKPKSSSSKTDAVVAVAAVPQFSLSVAGRNVQIAGARIGSAYAILDMQGRVLATGRTASASMEIAVPRAGSYMVRVGSQTKRVNVK